MKPIRSDIDDAVHFDASAWLYKAQLKKLADVTADGSVEVVTFGKIEDAPAVLAVADGYLYAITRIGLFRFGVVELWIPKITTVTWTDGGLFGSAHILASGVDLLLKTVSNLGKLRQAVLAATEKAV